MKNEEMEMRGRKKNENFKLDKMLEYNQRESFNFFFFLFECFIGYVLL